MKTGVLTLMKATTADLRLSSSPLAYRCGVHPFVTAPSLLSVAFFEIPLRPGSPIPLPGSGQTCKGVESLSFMPFILSLDGSSELHDLQITL